jgi:putative redox protein
MSHGGSDMVEARVRYLDGIQFVGEASSGHVIFMDGDSEGGGKNAGLMPTDLLLIGLGSCSGMAALSILRKKKQDLTGFEIVVRGEKEDEWPKRFTAITLEFIIKGNNLSETAVKRAIELSMEKYCTVKATLEGSPEMNFSFRILEEERNGANGVSGQSINEIKGGVL